MIKVANAFSLNMVKEFPATISVKEIDLSRAATIAANAESVVGHADTAAVFSSVLGVIIPCNRATVSLNKGDTMLVGQYIGPRLPEGATKLPEGTTIKWLLVTVA